MAQAAIARRTYRKMNALVGECILNRLIVKGTYGGAGGRERIDR